MFPHRKHARLPNRPIRFHGQPQRWNFTQTKAFWPNLNQRKQSWKIIWTNDWRIWEESIKRRDYVYFAGILAIQAYFQENWSKGYWKFVWWKFGIVCLIFVEGLHSMPQKVGNRCKHSSIQPGRYQSLHDGCPPQAALTAINPLQLPRVRRPSFCQKWGEIGTTKI